LEYNIKAIIAEEFNQKKIVTLKDLYQTVIKKLDNDWSETKKRHRVRSIIDSLLRTNKIKRIASSKYEKIVEMI